MNTTPIPLAYPGGAEQRQAFIDHARAHRDADLLAQRASSNPAKGQQGCMVACAVATARPELENVYQHDVLAEILGTGGEELPQLWDSIFEGLPPEEALQFPEDVFTAMQPGSDLSLVWPRLALWMLVDPEDGVVQYADDRGAAAIQDVARLFERRIAGDEPTAEEWAAAEAAADAADAAAGAARHAAGAAGAARDAATRAQRDKILELLAAAPIPAGGER